MSHLHHLRRRSQWRTTNNTFRPPRHSQQFLFASNHTFSEYARTEAQASMPSNIKLFKPDLSSTTLEWLKLRHLIDNTPSNEINNKAIQIFSVFGGIKSHLKKILNTSAISNPSLNKTQLLKLINLLQKKDENTSKNKNKNKSEIQTTNHNSPQIFNIKTLSNDMTSYLCSFLSFNDIHSLQNTCTDLAYICLDELKKIDIGIINFNSLINKSNIIHLGKGNELINNYRMYSNIKLQQAFNKWMTKYDIPSSQSLFYPLIIQGMSYRPDNMSWRQAVNLTDLRIDNNYLRSNYILFDLRNCYKTSMVNTNTNNIANVPVNVPIILKYFDIEKQKLYIVGAVLVSNDCIIMDLINVILNKVITNNIHLEYFKRLQIILNRIDIFESDINISDIQTQNMYKKLLLFRELSEFPHRCIEINKDMSGKIQLQYVYSNNGLIPGDTLIFQINPKHSYFSNCNTNKNQQILNTNYLCDNFDNIQLFINKNNKIKQCNEIKMEYSMNYIKIRNKYCYFNDSYYFDKNRNNSFHNLEMQYICRGLQMFHYAPFYCRYIQQTKCVKLIYRYKNKWENTLKYILKLNKNNNKIVSNKYYNYEMNFEMNINMSYGQIRHQIAFIYGIDPKFIEIWIPKSVINDPSFEYTSNNRGVWSDTIQSFANTNNFILPIQWEICGYETDIYDQILASELEQMQGMNGTGKIEEFITDCVEYNSMNNGPSSAIYRVVLISPNMNDNMDRKYIDVIYDKGFKVHLFIKHVLNIIFNQPILCNEYKHIFNDEIDENKLDLDVINNTFVLLTDTQRKRVLFGHDWWVFPMDNSVCDIDGNRFYLQMLQNEEKFKMSFVKVSELNENNTNSIVFKFWKCIDHKNEICGKILRVKVAANDNLKDIISNKLNNVSTEKKYKFYLYGSNQTSKSFELGTAIEQKNYKYFYPFTILLQDNNACINVLCL